MRIGELAELAGVTSRTVRHYHQIGLLPEPERRINGYREYSVLDATRLLRIRHLVGLGLGLDRIRGLLDLPGSGIEDELAGLEEALRDQIATLTRQLEIVRAARTSPLPEAPANYGELDELARNFLTDAAARRLEADLTLLMSAGDPATHAQVRAHAEAMGTDPRLRNLLSAAIGGLLAVTESTPEAERDRIANELRTLLAAAPMPDLQNARVNDLLEQYRAQAFTEPQLDVLARLDHEL
ncbi:MerR family transcriptional regulator [Ruania alkalisoli]|uniref:MerR family transcriptional regulator n=1 Tax=Ruania alkalisoli TaxID=2779775 RepID=A0A7M1STM0_9MICO|nr:MerR family transcriptional regulator [Ruania alkalisoli]QOR70801.1 MerR family transcriptional regulator [Ruania alkalisoli]